MKIKNLFITLGLAVATFAAIGVGLEKSFKEEKVVQAESTKVNLYLDVSATNWAGKNASIYVHYWGGEESSTWPGVALTKNDFGLYTTQVAADSTGLKFHVSENWGGDCETGDLVFDNTKTLWTITAQASPCEASAKAYAERTIYVLDKGANRLQVETERFAHLFGGVSYATTWPGVALQVESGHIYKVTFPVGFETVIWHNGNGNQTADLAIDANKPVSVLESDWNGATWISLEAAEFIDQYMHFADVGTDETGSTANCNAYYSAAKTAFNALSSDDARLDVLRVLDAKNRLEAWAVANGDTLDTSTGALSVSLDINALKENDNVIFVIIAVASVSVISAAIVLFLRKRRIHKA